MTAWSSWYSPSGRLLLIFTFLTLTVFSPLGTDRDYFR